MSTINASSQEFIAALVSAERSPVIPPEDDWFAPLLGSWAFHRTNLEADGAFQDTVGEWIFARVLEGKAIQDLFIWPPRSQRKGDVWEGEYGTTIRTYNPNTRHWDIAYANAGFIGRFEAVWDDEAKEIVQTNCADPSVRWTFSHITQDSFRWCDTRRGGDGVWKPVEMLELKRK